METSNSRRRRAISLKALGFSFALLAGVVLVTAVPSLAKSPPDRLVIQGGGLTAPVEIADASKLEGFSPWSRGFIDWSSGGPLEQPPLSEPRYTVSLYLEGRKIFVVEYVPAGGDGYVYVPDGSHPAFELNIGTIISGSSDVWNPNGKWQHATDAWNDAVQTALESAFASEREGPAEAAVLESRGSGPRKSVLVVGAGVALAVGAGALSFLLQRRRARRFANPL